MMTPDRIRRWQDRAQAASLAVEAAQNGAGSWESARELLRLHYRDTAELLADCSAEAQAHRREVLAAAARHPIAPRPHPGGER